MTSLLRRPGILSGLWPSSGSVSSLLPCSVFISSRCLSTQATIPNGSEIKKAFLEQVRELRYRTDAPLIDCSTALKESNGDLTAAIAILQQKGKARALKKAGRATTHGVVVSCLSPHAGAILSLATETDYALLSPHFHTACGRAREAVQQYLQNLESIPPPAAVEATVRALVLPDLEVAAGVLGENVMLQRLDYLAAGEGMPRTVLSGYVHGEVAGKGIGRLVGLVSLELLEGAAAGEAGESIRAAVAQHFVANVGEMEEDAVEGCDSGLGLGYGRQLFFGASPGEHGRVETVGQYLKRNRLRFKKSVIAEFGKPAVVVTAEMLNEKPKKKR